MSSALRVDHSTPSNNNPQQFDDLLQYWSVRGIDGLDGRPVKEGCDACPLADTVIRRRRYYCCHIHHIIRSGTPPHKVDKYS